MRILPVILAVATVAAFVAEGFTDSRAALALGNATAIALGILLLLRRG